jgi:hypothetical protein
MQLKRKMSQDGRDPFA